VAQVSPPLRDLGTEAKLRTNPSFNAWTTVESVVRWGISDRLSDPSDSGGELELLPLRYFKPSTI
jgi:hypothetical protein